MPYYCTSRKSRNPSNLPHAHLDSTSLKLRTIIYIIWCHIWQITQHGGLQGKYILNMILQYHIATQKTLSNYTLIAIHKVVANYNDVKNRLILVHGMQHYSLLFVPYSCITICMFDFVTLIWPYWCTLKLYLKSTTSWLVLR